MRPRLSELEMSFLLDLLKETRGSLKRQFKNFMEEMTYQEQRVLGLRKIFLLNPYPTIHLYKDAERRLKSIKLEWDPILTKKEVLIECLIIRLEKILSHKKGRVPHTSYFYERYLKEWNQKTLKTQDSQYID